MSQTSSQSDRQSDRQTVSEPGSPISTTTKTSPYAALQKKLPLFVEDIEQIIPHRYPFLMVDRITEFVDAERIVGQKNVSALDPWFTGHFPGRPIMPGVLMLEALAQLGVIFARLSTGGCAYDALMVFTGAEKVRFRRIVVPGDVLTLELLMAKRKLAYWKMAGRILVGDEVAMEAEISAAETKN